MILETPRLKLRPLRLSDADDLYDCCKDPAVGPSAGWKPHESIEETREIMQAVFLDREGIFGMELGENGRIVGSVGLMPYPKRENPLARMIGYSLGRPYWGRGLMTEAVRRVLDYGWEELSLSLISACCYPENARSKSVLQKCGFQYEGTLRLAEVLYDGRVLDHECYILLNPRR